MQLNDLKISTRLVFGFGILGLLLAFMAAVSVVKFKSMNAMFDEVINDQVPKIAVINDIKADVTLIADALRNMLIMSNSADIRAEGERIEVARKRIGERFARLDAQLVSNDARGALAAVVQARAVYEPLQAEAMELAIGGQTFEAKALLLDKVRPAQKIYFDALDRLLKQQDALMQQSASATQAATANMVVVIGATVVAALAAGVVMALWIIRSITGPINLAVAVSRAVAGGDLSLQFDTRGKNEIAQLLQALKEMQLALVSVVADVREGAEAVARASAGIAQSDLDLSSRTESQAHSLQDTTSSMEQLGEQVNLNAANASKANALAVSASEVAARGGAAVSEVIVTMKGINESSHKISDIIAVIDGIAFQTNILALNAAVEAARAGEQGRGFAVVASEVRSLAGRSAEAAREIKGLISASVQRVEQGTVLVDKAGATMAEVVSSIRHVTTIMAEISAASEAQSEGVSQLGVAIQLMDQMTQQNAQLVDVMSVAAGSLQSQADALVNTVEVFKLGQSVGRGQLALAAPQV
ncbi:MAG: MCP four helix bundle domain-containing protein [Rhodoferax sp.]|uniref:methyl-accepting chemotaxis protein n=1 Tax=Rhodoferax sp. TaxID=50421 RepID=UPI001B5E057A|nr:methyl-accepting chemotaxis protein [Rhodoferax sp.]MBP9904838.1 MCP four helix bundle domain-containing protein [Rhodoferax sp.]